MTETESISTHTSDGHRVEATGSNPPGAALLETMDRRAGTSKDEGEGVVSVMPERFQETSLDSYSKQELEGLVHVLIYRIDMLLACLKLAEWGDQDFSSTIEETEALLRQNTFYDIGHKMAHLMQAYESVAVAAMTTARYSMFAPGYAQSAAQLEKALAALAELREGLPPTTRPDHEPG